MTVAKPDLSETLFWLSDASVHDMPIEAVMDGFHTRLNAQGFDIARAHLSTTALHPLVSAYSLNWYVDKTIDRLEMENGAAPNQAWVDSPLHHMLTNREDFMRQRLDGSNAAKRFPVFAEFAEEGMTDWVCVAEGFNWSWSYSLADSAGMIVSWTTRRPGGFADDVVTVFPRLVTALAGAVKTNFLNMIAHDVLGAYLGAEPARRVLTGDIARGSVTEIPAVIMMADIKGFTKLSTSRPIGEVVAVLNATFDVVAREVHAHGGHILKFMGDGVLAIFLLENRADDVVASEALSAAIAIQKTLPTSVGVDIGMHMGDVHYGNVGAAGRLDFTAIGPAVNEAARLEPLCGVLGYSVLVSGKLAAAAPRFADKLVPLGSHELRGFDEPRPVFGLKLD